MKNTNMNQKDKELLNWAFLSISTKTFLPIICASIAFTALTGEISYQKDKCAAEQNPTIIVSRHKAYARSIDNGLLCMSALFSGAILGIGTGFDTAMQLNQRQREE